MPLERGMVGGAHAVSIQLIIGGTGQETSSRSKRPSFISAATAGVDMKVMSGATVVDEAAVDVSPGTAACGGATGSPRSCSGTTGLLTPGTYTLVATTYDQAPVSGAIPGGAHVLAKSTVSGIVVTSRTTTMATVYVGGVVTAYGAPGFVSVSGDGAAHQVGFALAPTDYANEPIVAGVNDSYANPITLTLTETGGSGHAVLKLNGVNVGSSATIAKSSDAVQVSYDGAAPVGYYATVTISASGVATTNVNVSPMFVALSAYATGSALNFTAAGETSTAAITEAGAPGSATYAASGASCSGIASIGAVSGSGASASVVLTAGTTGAAGCTVTITDNVGTSASVPVNVTTTITNTTVTVPGGYAEYAVAGGGGAGNLDSIRLGADGRMWFVEFNSSMVSAIDTGGTITRYATATASSNPTGVALGPDGRMWYAQNSKLRLGAMKTDGTTVDYPISQGAFAVAAGPDERLWFTEPTANAFGVMTTGGLGLTEYVLGAQALDIAAGPDGRVWALDQSFAKIYAIGTGANGTTQGAVTTYTAGISGGANLSHIAAGPDGAMWFTENNKSKIGRITTSGTVTEYSTTVGQPKGIVAGPDGSMWYTDNSFNGRTIGKIGTGVSGTTLGAVARYTGSAALGMSGTPSGIGAGADGNMWFTERQSNTVVKFTP